MKDEAFSDLVAEIAKSTSSANIKSDFEWRVHTINASLNNDYECVKYEIHLKGCMVLSMAQECKYFTSFLGARSINSAKIFVAYVLPLMVRNLEGKRRGKSLSVTTPTPANNNKSRAKSTGTTGRYQWSTNTNHK